MASCNNALGLDFMICIKDKNIYHLALFFVIFENIFMQGRTWYKWKWLFLAVRRQFSAQRICERELESSADSFSLHLVEPKTFYTTLLF